MKVNKSNKFLLKALICTIMLSSTSCTTALAAIVHEDGNTHDYEYVDITDKATTVTGQQVAVAAKQFSTIKFTNGLSINLNTATVGTDQITGILTDVFSKVDINGDLNLKMVGDAGSKMTGIDGSILLNGNSDINIIANQADSAYGYKSGITNSLNGGVHNITINSDASKSLGGVIGNIELSNNAKLNIDITSRKEGWLNGVPNWRQDVNGIKGSSITVASGSELNIKLDLDKTNTFGGITNAAQRRDVTRGYSYNSPAGIYVLAGATTPSTFEAGSKTTIEVSGAPIGTTPASNKDNFEKTFGIGSVVGIGAIGNVNVNGDMTIKVTSEKGVAIRVDDNNGNDFNGAHNYVRGNINLEGNTIIETNNGFALMSETIATEGDNRYEGFGANRPTVDGDHAQININLTGGHLVQITGDLDHRTAYLSYYKLNLDNAQSFLRGSSMKTNDQDVYGNGQVAPIRPEGYTDITLANGATWYMTGKSDNNTTGNSIVNILTLNNKGYIDMTPSGTSGYETLTAAELHGNDGRLLMNTDLQKSFDNKNVMTDSDRLIITGASSAGTHIIDVKDASLLTKIAAEGYLLLVQDESQGDAKFVGGELRKGGIFKYQPIITDEPPAPGSGYGGIPADSNNWYLTGFEKLDVIQDETIMQVGLAESRYTSYMNEQDTLIKRLGELRQNDKDRGIWARVRGANNSVDGVGVSRNSYVSTHLGYDWRLNDSDTTKNYMGIAFNHTNNNFDYALGTSGKGQSNVLTIYGTRLGDKGHYLDLVGKIGRMSNDYKYQENTVEAKNWFYSLSAEYGRNIVGNNGWYYEPQVQLTLGRINGTSYNSNDTHVDADGITSAILRSGILAGRKFNTDKQEKLGSYYAKVFYNYEFGGDVKASMSDTFGDNFSFSNSYKGGWITVGLGTALNLNKKTNLYLDVEKAFGGKVSGGWAWQGGVRWRF